MVGCTLFSCCKPKYYRATQAWQEMVEAGSGAVKRDLDLIRFVRAKRMHGFGLTQLLPNIQRNNVSDMAYTRPIREKPANFGALAGWYRTEGLDRYD